MKALVLSGGGMFGAWQAGAWSALADRFQPDLVVGASVGSLNGYAIAGGATPEELCDFWLHPEAGNFSSLPETIRELMRRFPLRSRFAVVLTDLLRLKPKIFRDGDVTWRHLAASCAIPGILPQYKIGTRWYSDGGLLNPLPIWAAVELGATKIVALNALPEIPSRWMKPLVKGFRYVKGFHPPLAPGIEVMALQTDGPIGTMREALQWERGRVGRWIEMGRKDAEAKESGVSMKSRDRSLLTPDSFL
jgi:NTE family protein